MKRLVKENEVSNLTGIPLSTLRADRIRERRIPFIKLGRSCLYDPDEVFAALDRFKVVGPSSKGAR